jgi:hypothetical protein
MPKKISTKVLLTKSQNEWLATKYEDKPLPKDSFIKETIKRSITLPPFLREAQTMVLTFVLSQLRLMTPSAEILLADWCLKSPKKKPLTDMPKSNVKESNYGDELGKLRKSSKRGKEEEFTKKDRSGSSV